MVQTRSQSSSEQPAPSAQPPPRQRRRTSVISGNRLYLKAVQSISRSTGASPVEAEVSVPEANIVSSAEGTSKEDQLRTEVQRLWTESDSHRNHITEFEMQISALTSAFDSLRVEHHPLASHSQDSQIAATVRTLRDDLNQVMERPGNASGAMPGLPVDME